VAIRIPLYDVATENRQFADDFRAALDRVVLAGRFVGGPEIAHFEPDLARYCEVVHAVGVKSGTDAIVLALKALGIGPGDEVITTPFTFFASAEAVVLAGARPVFADVEPGTLCLSPEACEDAITGRTKAVLLVHVFGHCADMDRFTDLCGWNKLALVEDAAQAIGSTWKGRRLGSIGACGTLSFYPTKNLGALGNAGAVLTSDLALAANIRSLQNHGKDSSGRYTRFGCNSSLDELQAAFLRIKLARLDAELARRREIAARYDAELPESVRRVAGAEGCQSNYHQYAIRTDRRDALRQFLVEQGIETGAYYSTPLHREPAFAPTGDFSAPGLHLLEAERACSEVLTLPVRPSLTNEKQTAVVESIRRFFAEN
jgi:dTDP-4-amino-4,6-dideoxygalactose transaminase